MSVPSVFLAETLTGRIWTQLDGVTGNVSDDLFGSDIRGRFTVPVRPGLRPLLAQPWRAAVVLADPERIWWAGPVTAPPTRGRGGAAEVTCGSLWSLLERRPAWRPDALPPAAAADLVLTNLSLRGLAAALLEAALAWGPLPVVVPAGPFPGVHQRVYPSHELHDVASRLANLLDDDDAGAAQPVEVHFAPRWADGGHNRFEWAARLGDPRLDAPAAPWVWDAASTAVTALVDHGAPGELASTAWVGGDGQDRAKVIGHATSAALTDAGWPALHAIDASSHASVSDPATADAHARAALSEPAAAAATLVPVVRADGAPDPRTGAPTAPAFGQWQVGDRLRVDVTGDDWTPEGSYSGRIGGWSYTLGGADIALALDQEPTEAG